MSSHSQKSNSVRPIAGDPPPSAAAENANASSAGGNSNGFEQLREIISDSVELLKRQKKVFFCVAGGLASVLSLFILVQTPLYESTALMLVKIGRELVYQQQIGAEQSFASRNNQTVINSELAILRSLPVLEGVVRATGVEVLYPELGDALLAARAARTDPNVETRDETLLVAEVVERLRATVSTLALPEAEVLQVSYRHPDPIVAATTVNHLVDRFLEAHVNAFAQPEVANFLEQRVSEFEERLAEAERELREFETAHAAFALAAPQEALLGWSAEVRAQLETIETQTAEIRMSHMQNDAAVAEARSTLLALKVEASQLKGSALADSRNRIAVVQSFIRSRQAEVNAEIRRLEQKKAPLEERLAIIDGELAQLPAFSSEYRRLVRERDGDEEQYRTYGRRLRDARLSSEMDREKIASINVIQPGSPAARPVWPPKKGLSVVLAVVLSAIAGVLFLVLVEHVGPTGIAFLDEGRKQGAAK